MTHLDKHSVSIHGVIFYFDKFKMSLVYMPFSALDNFVMLIIHYKLCQGNTNIKKIFVPNCISLY